MTQVYFRGHEASFPFTAGSADGWAVAGRMFATDFRESTFFSSFSGSFFSLGVGIDALAAMAALLKSKAVPGVFGVFAAEPNEAKAPEPSPKADEPPVVGEDMPLVVSGATELKGLFLPCDEVLPKRLELEKSRGAWPSLPSCLSVLSMANDSLPTLQSSASQSPETS